MKSMERRLKALEGQAGSREPVIGAIVRCLVRPGPKGPISLGVMHAAILSGPSAGMQLSRAEGESAEAFQERCNAMVEAEQ